MKPLAEETIAAYCNKLLPFGASCKIWLLAQLSTEVKNQIRIHKQSETMLSENRQEAILKKIIGNKGTSTTVLRQKNIPKWASWGATIAMLCFFIGVLPNTELGQAKGSSLGVTLYEQQKGKAEIREKSFSMIVGDTLQALPVGEDTFFLTVFAKDSNGLAQIFPKKEVSKLVSSIQMPSAMILETAGENWLFFVSSLEEGNVQGLRKLLQSWKGEHSLFLGGNYIQAYKIEGVQP